MSTKKTNQQIYLERLYNAFHVLADKWIIIFYKGRKKLNYR